jgi:ankyrin repeat protein
MKKLRKVFGILIIAGSLAAGVVWARSVRIYGSFEQLFIDREIWSAVFQYPFYVLSAINALLILFALWLGILLKKDKFSKNKAVIVAVILIILPICSHFITINNVDTINRSKFVSYLNSNEPSKIQKIINKGFDVNGIGNPLNAPPLHLAITYNRHDIVKILIENGADVNATDPLNGYTALMAALGGYPSPNYDTVKLLLERGADANRSGGEDVIPLFVASSPDIYKNEASPEIIKLLIESGADVNKLTARGFTPVMFAAGAGAANASDIIKIFADNGADINLKGDDMLSALHLAAQKGDINVCKYLIEQGMNVKDRNNKYGRTVLHSALMPRRGIDTELLKLLLEKGAGINDKDAAGATALLYACGWLDFGVCKYLIENGADIKAKSNNGKTFADYLQGNDRMPDSDKTELMKLIANR